jgi:hypothetical protein
MPSRCLQLAGALLFSVSMASTAFAVDEPAKKPRPKSSQSIPLKPGIHRLGKLTSAPGVTAFAIVEPSVVRVRFKDDKGHFVPMYNKAVVTTSCSDASGAGGSCQCYGSYDTETQTSESLGCTDSCSEPGAERFTNCTTSVMDATE